MLTTTTKMAYVEGTSVMDDKDKMEMEKMNKWSSPSRSEPPVIHVGSAIVCNPSEAQAIQRPREHLEIRPPISNEPRPEAAGTVYAASRITYESDGEAVDGLRRREPAAMEALYDRLSRPAFGLAYRMLGDGGLAEDVVQEAFLAVWRKAERIDSAVGSLRSLLFAIVHNKAIDALRSRRGAAKDLRLEPIEFKLAQDDFTDRVNVAVDGAIVREALASLPDDQRRVVELAYYKGLTHLEISELLGLPLGTVKSRLRLAVHKLRITVLSDFQAIRGGDADGELTQTAGRGPSRLRILASSSK